MLEKTLENPLDFKEIQPVNPKENQSWIFIGRTDAKAETPILWPPDRKNWLLKKEPDAGKKWRQEETGMTEDEMVGWHHWLDGHEFERTLGVEYGQVSLECCSPWGHKELDSTEQLNWLMFFSVSSPFIFCVPPLDLYLGGYHEVCIKYIINKSLFFPLLILSHFSLHIKIPSIFFFPLWYSCPKCF